MKNIDKKIKHIIQSWESEIPGKVEQNFLKMLDQNASEKPYPNRRMQFFLRIALGSVASILIALFIFFPFSPKKTVKSPSGEILVQYAKIQGKSARVIIYKEKNPELVIAWIEK